MLLKLARCLRNPKRCKIFLINNKHQRKFSTFAFAQQLLKSNKRHYAFNSTYRKNQQRISINKRYNLSTSTSHSSNVNNENNHNQHRHVIIGGGIAGVHMATILAKKGYKNITILEKSNRIGGKTFSIKDNNLIPGHTITHELGACYLHEDYKTVFGLLNEFDPKNKLHSIINRRAVGTIDYNAKYNELELECLAIDASEVNINIGDIINDAYDQESATPLEFATNEGLKHFETSSKWRERMVNILTTRIGIRREVLSSIILFFGVRKYIKIHEKIFGKDSQNLILNKSINLSFYPFLKKPNKNDMDKLLSIKFIDFLKLNGLDILIPMLMLANNSNGYGDMKYIPAFYGLYWTSARFLKHMFNIKKVLKKESLKIFCLENGFESLCKQMHNKYKNEINIIYNVDINSIDRNLNVLKLPSPKLPSSQAMNCQKFGVNSNTKPTIIYYNGTEKIECDNLYLACNMSYGNGIDLLKDGQPDEIEIFNNLRSMVLSVTLYECDVSNTNGHDHNHNHDQNDDQNQYHTDYNLSNTNSVELSANNTWHCNGQLFGQRNSAICILGEEKYKKLMKNGNITKERWMAYQFLYNFEYFRIINDGENSNDYVELKRKFNDILYQNLQVQNKKNVKFVDTKIFNYFPIWDENGLKQFYPWIVKDELQGKYNNTYYIGSSVCFESVAAVVQYNAELDYLHNL